MGIINSKKKKIKILISNDDGIESLGLQALANELKKIGEVVVVAPEREQSTMGHALTLHKPVRLYKIKMEKGMRQFALSGTPADCVYVGIRYVLKSPPDIIVSGINRGVNLGNDMFYSGTIAAAREGTVLNIPAIATSMDYTFEPGKTHNSYFEDAAKYTSKLVKEVLKKGLPHHNLLNVNYPNLPLKKVKGVKITKQGIRMYTDLVEEKLDNRKKPYLWLGGEYKGFEPIPESDCVAMDKKFISIMPCRLDLTNYEFMKELETWDLDIPK